MASREETLAPPMRSTEVSAPTDESPRPWPSKIGMLILFYCAAFSFDLFDAWRTSPVDRLAWVALLIWLSPLAILRWIDRERNLIGRESLVLYAMALVSCLMGQLGAVNAFEHVALLLAMTGLLRWTWKSGIWLASGVSWMPAFGYLVVESAPDQVLTLRVALALVGAGIILAPLAHRQPAALARANWKRWGLSIGVVIALLVGALWRFVPLRGAENRLLAMPTQGPSFRSWSVPLKAEERSLLGEGLAARRLYEFGSTRALVSIVDGTRNRHAVHDPRYCFLGAGFHVQHAAAVPVVGGEATLLRLERNGQRTQIVYWFSDGSQRHGSFTRYWWQTTLRRITWGNSGAEPVLVIVQCSDRADARGLLEKCRPLFDV